jgi:hypothetical protein
MYASIWRFTGDPDQLMRRYDAMLAEIPSANMRLHLCLRTPDGIVIVDTCPSREVFEQFAAGPFPALRSRHSLPEPKDVQDGPVHVAFVNGNRALEPTETLG